MERFNRMLLDMLSKTVKAGGKDWDDHLPYLISRIGQPYNYRRESLRFSWERPTASY